MSIGNGAWFMVDGIFFIAIGNKKIDIHTSTWNTKR